MYLNGKVDFTREEATAIGRRSTESAIYRDDDKIRELMRSAEHDKERYERASKLRRTFETTRRLFFIMGPYGEDRDALGKGHCDRIIALIKSGGLGRHALLLLWDHAICELKPAQEVLLPLLVKDS